MFPEQKYRATIRKKITFEGIGIHGGEEVQLTLYPAPAHTGRVFRHVRYSSLIPARVSHVIDTRYAVTLGNSEWSISTVEHILAALSLTGITDCILEVNGKEVPILDGSAKQFVEEIEKAGLHYYKERLKVYRPRSPVWVMRESGYLVLLPSKKPMISFTIDFPHPRIQTQTLQLPLNREVLKREVAQARTFGFLSDVHRLQAHGLALGGSVENAIIFTKHDYLNSSLRYENECIRHKVLDLIGDISLLGMPVSASIIAMKSGHEIDVELIRRIEDRLKAKKALKKKREIVPTVLLSRLRQGRLGIRRAE